MTSPYAFLLPSLVGLGLATWTYGQVYQRRHGLKPSNDREQVFDVDSWQAKASGQYAWLSQAQFDQEMTDWVQPYLAQHGQSETLTLEDGQTLAFDFYPHAEAQATLLIIHGLNEFKEKFRELTYYWHQEGCQVIAVDLRGHGASGPYGPKSSVHSLRFDQYAEDLARLLDHLIKQGKIQGPLVLFGHSMGGAVATRLCQLYPGLAQGLILSSPMLAIDTGKIPFAYAHLLSRLVSSLGGGKAYAPRQGAFDPERHSQYPRQNRWTTQYERGHYFHHWHLANHPTPSWGATWSWLATSLASSRKILSRQGLDQLTLPVLVWRAELDDHVLASGIHGLTSSLAQAQAYCVPGRKHELYLEDDAFIQAYVTCIRHFIASLAPASGH